MVLKGKKIAMLVEEHFEDSELQEPLIALKEAGAIVSVVGSGSKSEYSGKRGKIRILPDTVIDKVKPSDFDAVIVPGGYAPDKMRMHQAMIDLVKQIHDAGGIVAAICHGPQLLISADIVKGRTVTSWPSVTIDLENAGAKWVDQPVVRDGNIITSRKPGDIPQFNQAIVEALAGR